MMTVAKDSTFERQNRRGKRLTELEATKQPHEGFNKNQTDATPSETRPINCLNTKF